MDILQTILHRRSIRRFDTRQIEEETLQKILQAGLYAPSAGGRQGVIFAVSQNREVNERLGKIKRANSYFGCPPPRAMFPASSPASWTTQS